jgi:glutamate racemase
MAIGMFDSGFGGLTVMRQVAQDLPHESIIYFGDTARLPYGDKSKETILRYALENTIFLMDHKIKLLVVACNTVSVHSLEKLQQVFNLPIIGVIDPGVEKIVSVTQNKKIAVLGTRGTINSGVYQRKISEKLPGAEITAIPCPLFVPIVEEKMIHHPIAKLVVKEYLAPLKENDVDTVMLACTHYPLLKDVIKEELGEGVAIVDSASTCAEKVGQVLDTLKLRAEEHNPMRKYFVSDDPEKFRKLGAQFLGMPIEHVELSASCWSSQRLN